MSGDRTGGVVIRPMRPDDVAVAERISAEAFLEVDRATFARHRPEPELRPVARAENWRVRTADLLRTDPGGCWVADVDGLPAGFAVGFVREGLWCLATYAVRPGLQGRGIGRPLLEAAMQHGRGCLRGMLSSSADPRAVRRYLLAGFRMHPQMSLSGTVDRTAIPVVERVREGSDGDRDLLDSLDRQTRGSAHGPDHAHLARAGRLLVSDTTAGSGYVYCDERSVGALAASNRRTAARLLWAALAGMPGEVRVSHVTAANDWAIDVGTAARLELHTEGYLALRGMKPPSPYLHHGALM